MKFISKFIVFFIVLGFMYLNSNGQAKIKFEKNSYTFKPWDSGKVYHFYIPYRNEGKDPLIINFIRVSDPDYCRVEYSKEPLNPRKKGVIKLICSMKDYNNLRFSNSIMVYSNCLTPRNVRIIQFTVRVNQ